MGTLHPGLSYPTAIPLQNHLYIIDLKDCFFYFPTPSRDRENFAFSLPSTNHQVPYKRYHWKVLPQGIASSPAMCQEFVAAALEAP
jgi:hypothetical protein